MYSEIKCRIVMAKAAFNKEALYTSKWTAIYGRNQ
jgi:hypothetical protein